MFDLLTGIVVYSVFFLVACSVIWHFVSVTGFIDDTYIDLQLLLYSLGWKAV